MEVEDTEGMTLREIKLSRRILLLERQLADHRSESRRGGQNSKKFDIQCYNCGKLGHIANNCQGGNKQGNDPNKGFGSKCVRQAN